MMKYLMNKITSLLCFALLATGLMAQPERIVNVTPGFATVIVCPAPPELVTVGNMDAFSVQSAGNYVLVKPLVTTGTTNMFLKAGKESFNLLLRISDTPDLEVRLTSGPVSSSDKQAGSANTGENESFDGSSRRKSLSSLSPKALSVLSTRFKAANRYTHSVNNSKIIFAIDHLKQVRNKLYIIGTIINNSNIPYDIGFVRFRLVDYNRSYFFWKKKIKETEFEPVNEYYNPRIEPHSSGRMLFIFDKHGFSERSWLNIKCNEESGRRDLELEVPGTMVE
jgi:hypothetical protein